MSRCVRFHRPQKGNEDSIGCEGYDKLIIGNYIKTARSMYEFSNAFLRNVIKKEGTVHSFHSKHKNDDEKVKVRN